MPGSWFSIRSIVCLALAGLLATGYLARSGFAVAHGPRVLHWLPIGEIAVGVEEGRFKVMVVGESSPGRLMIPAKVGFDFFWTRPRFRVFNLRRSLWAFDAHGMTRPPTKTWIFACPLWCLIMPLLISPLTEWQRLRRRRRIMQHGFLVS